MVNVVDNESRAAEVAWVRQHIEYKSGARELAPQVAERMLAALDTGADPDYMRLLQSALALPLPRVCFHTAPTSQRASILEHGLQARAPHEGANWGDKAAGQPRGVYVGPIPDVRGMWAHEDTWDVWEITSPDGTPFGHDRLNQDCWILGDVPVDRIRLHGAYGW